MGGKEGNRWPGGYLWIRRSILRAITGRSPFTADTVPAIMMKVMVDPLPRPKKYCKDIPDSVEKVIFKALARKPENTLFQHGRICRSAGKTNGRKKLEVF